MRARWGVRSVVSIFGRGAISADEMTMIVTKEIVGELRDGLIVFNGARRRHFRWRHPAVRGAVF